MADKKKMSVEEILAAARKSDSAGGSAPPPAAKEPAPAEPAAEASAESAPAKPAAAKPAAGKPAAAKPAAAKPAAGGKPGAMSVADILAAARGEKQAAAAAPAPAAPKPAPKAAAPKAPAAKPAAEKPAAEKTAAATSAAKDTASILAAARAAAKPGPISKSELAARGKEVEMGKKKPVAPPMPDKPAYAQPRPAAVAPATATGRRGFMQTVGAGILAASAGSALALGFSSLAVTFNLWVLGFARFMFPNILTEPPTKFKVGFPNELAQGQVQTKFVPQFGVWIVRHEYDGAPQIYALQTVCTHLGCTPNWLEGEQKFKCPCHGSGFYKDGVNFEGPAPRPLERFAIRLADDGQLEVDKSRKFKEELGQWRDTASFVPV